MAGLYRTVMRRALWIGLGTLCTGVLISGGASAREGAGVALSSVCSMPAVADRRPGGPRDALTLHQAIDRSSRVAPDDLVRRIETETVALTNAVRQEVGSPVLQSDGDLAAVARFYSRDMLGRDYFGHISPEGVELSERVGVGHRRFIGLAGENLYVVQIPTRDPVALARRAVEGWRKSPAHWPNMRNPRHTHIGIGVARHGTCYVFTQLFMRVQALLRTPLPIRARRGNPLELMLMGGRTPQDIEYGLARLKDEVLSFGPYPLGEGRPDLPAADYVTKFHFLSGNMWNIFPGPIVVLR